MTGTVYSVLSNRGAITICVCKIPVFFLMPRDIDFACSMAMSKRTLLTLAVKLAVKFNGGILYMFVPQ